MKFTHSHQLVSFLNNCLPYAKNRYAENRINVLISLAHYWSAERNETFPSNSTIAALTTLGLRTVERIVSEFKATGLLGSQARYNSSSIRWFNIEKLAVTIGGLTKVDKSTSISQQDTSVADIVFTSLEGMKQAIQDKAFRRGCDFIRKTLQKASKKRTEVDYEELNRLALEREKASQNVVQPQIERTFDVGSIWKKLGKRKR